ncbi:hypothetical protein DSECCO2_569520 [anaerobic digester metagenome]
MAMLTSSSTLTRRSMTPLAAPTTMGRPFTATEARPSRTDRGDVPDAGATR